MRNVLSILFVMFFFICCNNESYKENAYTKIRVKRFPVALKDIKEVKAIPNSRDSLSYKKKKYHIIVASSKSLSKAKRILAFYKRKGYKATILESKSRYRVSLGDFVDKEQSGLYRNKYSKSLNRSDLWIIKN